MKTFFVTIQLLSLVILPGLSVSAAQMQSTHKANSKVVSSATKNGTTLSTDMSFDGLMVNGQRQAPFGATATVENEKEMPSLVDFRNNFDDRITHSRSGR